MSSSIRPEFPPMAPHVSTMGGTTYKEFPLRDNQKKEVLRWRNGERHDQYWLRVMIDAKYAVHNCAVFEGMDRSISRIMWPTLGFSNFLHMYDQIKQAGEV